MALNFASSPYFDDYDPNKGFLKILYKPGYAVQARELTQTQDILQNQIGNFGAFIFQSGSPVLGGQITMDLKVNYANLNPLYNNTAINITSFANSVITDAATQTIRASVIATIPAIVTNPPTLMIKYLTGTTFPNGANITIYGSNTGPYALLANTNAVGNGSCASIQNGIYYLNLSNLNPVANSNANTVITETNAYFVNVPQQTIVLDAYDNTPTYMVGLQISDAIISSQTDSSLLDPALGSTNYQAPGADRYIINTVLSTRQLQSQDLSSFVSLLTVSNGVLQAITTDPQLSGIMNTLAKRTYDQSGSFTVKPFRMTLLDTANADPANSNTQLYYAAVGPGNAYVDGFNYQTVSKQYLSAPRARTIANVSQYSIQTYFGNYFLVDTVQGEFNFSTLPSLDMHCVNASNIVFTSTATYTNTLIGTASLRSFEFNSAANTSNGLTYVFRAGLFNVNTRNIILYTSLANNSTTISFSPGASPVTNAYAGMYLNVPSTGDTRFITSYNGATLTANLASAFSSLPVNNSQVLVIGAVPDVESIGLNTAASFITANANINIGSKNQSNNYLYSFLSDTAFTPIIFNFPNSTIAQGLQNPSYQYRAKIATNQTLTAGAPLVINLSISGDPSATFVSGTEGGSDLITLSDFLAVTNPGGVGGVVIPMIAALSRNVSTTSTTATFNTPSGGPTFTNVDIFASVKTTIGAKSKTLILANTTFASFTGGTAAGPATVYTTTGQINFATPSTSNLLASGIPQDLYISDGVGIAAIIDSGFLGQAITSAMVQAAVNNTAMPAGSINITNNYTFFNGQKDAVYDHSTITLNPGAPVPVGQVMVLLNYYLPSATGGYFTVDSYPTYITIPTYYSTSFASFYNLRDCIDFRPVRDAATTAYTFNNAGVILMPEPIPSAGFTVSYGYYLGRVDQLVLTSTGQFVVVQGSSSLNPFPAQIPKKAMLLYAMVLPPYTAYAANVVITQQNNQRYTMGDIGNLEKRIQTLEYYNSLNQVEQAATNQNITDSNGVVVPQLGLLVDAFTGSSVASVGSPDYAAAIDGQNQILRPSFTLNSAGMEFDPTTSSNYQLNGVTLTLPYKINTFISQNVASRLLNLNPFNITNWNGTLTLNPPSDIWISTTSIPAVTTNLSGDNDAYQAGTSIVMGTTWNNWQTIYTGVSSTSCASTIPPVTIACQPIIALDNPWVACEIAAGNPPAFSTTTTTTTTTTAQNQTRTGVQTVLSVDQLTTPIGSRIVSTSVIPYMRSLAIIGQCRGMKPLTKVYPFIDNINVSNYTKSLMSTIVFEGNVNFAQNVPSGTEFLIDQDGGTNHGYGANSAQVLMCKGNIAYVANVRGVIYPGKVFTGSISGNSGFVQSYNHFSGATNEPASNLYKGSNWNATTTPTINATSISLHGASSNVDGYYVGNTIYVVDSNQNGISSTIASYNGAARICTVNPPWNAGSLLTNQNVVVNYSMGSLTTDASGDIVLGFWIPDNNTVSFPTGISTFLVTDSPNGDLNNADTKATAQFLSQGTMDVSQQEYVTTLVPCITTQTVSQSQVVVSQQTSQTVARNLVGYYDPLAQNFLIDNNSYPNGVFITSIRVCFQSVDPVLPVTLQIRPTDNGYPSSSVIIPGSQVTLLPSQCNTTFSPSLDVSGQFTEFFFNDPIFLLPGNEFSIVLITNSNNYNIYTAFVGDVQLGTNQLISSPPYLGVLFESQNSSTWSPTQGASLMFRVTRAIFNTNPGFATFKNSGFTQNVEFIQTQPSSEFYMDTMYVTNNDQTSNGTSISYGFRGTANAGLRTFDTAYNSFVPNQNYYFANRYVVTSSYGSFWVQSQLTTPSQDISPIIDVTRYSVIGIGNVINNGSIGNNQITITNPGNLYNVAAINSVTVNGPGGSGASLGIGGVNANGNITSIIVETNGGGSSFYGSANITISSSGYSPVQANAVFNGELSPSFGNYLARYISRTVILSPGVVAGNLQVWIDAYLPQGTVIYIYYKILSPSDISTFQSRPWVQMALVGTQKVATIQNSFATYQYVGSLNQYGNPINSISYGQYNTFNQFAVKIVMGTINQAVVPLLKNLRVYALPASS